MSRVEGSKRCPSKSADARTPARIAFGQSRGALCPSVESAALATGAAWEGTRGKRGPCTSAAPHLSLAVAWREISAPGRRGALLYLFIHSRERRTLRLKRPNSLILMWHESLWLLQNQARAGQGGQEDISPCALFWLKDFCDALDELRNYCKI